MKFFITALVILTVIIVLCAWGSVESIDKIDAMVAALDGATLDTENVPVDAAEISARIGEEWEKSSFLISMLLPHHYLDEVKEKWVELDAYAGTDEFAEWKEAKQALTDELLHIRGLITVNADNIF